MAVYKPAELDDYSLPNDTLSTTFGAIPPLTITQLPNVTVNSGTFSTGYTIGGGAGLGTNANAVWTTSGTSYNWSSVGAVQPLATIKLTGDDADIDMNGKSLKKWMEAMEERMNWMHPNTALEAEWDELKELGDQYRAIEKKCKEKADMWHKLKNLPKSDIE